MWYNAGGRTVGDELYEQIYYPTAERLLQICDAVLRLPGDSKGVDNDVRLAGERGLPVYFDISEVPPAQGAPEGALTVQQ